jgi:signal transduction histidine kinase
MATPTPASPTQSRAQADTPAECGAPASPSSARGQPGGAADLRPGQKFALVTGLNLIIAILSTLLGGIPGFLEPLAEVSAVGYGIWGVAELLRWVTRGRMRRLTVLAIAIPAGFLVGGRFCALFGAQDFVAMIVSDPAHQWRSITADIVLACAAIGFFMLYARSEALRADLQTERRRSAEVLQSETSARLALLQAQIEPHFLFNTLANAQSVVDSDPAAAKAILEHLNQYLRVSLNRTRRPTGTLGEELSLVRALLGIGALRLGDRLRFHMAVPPELEAATLPPLLLQPLVENAIKHGIEPSIQGGEIRVEAQRDGETLRLRVIDSGVGFDPGSPEGVGLRNVRGRLAQLYGERGRLAIFRSEPHGATVELLLPLQGL